jgi:transcription antitermination factor NusG
VKVQKEEAPKLFEVTTNRIKVVWKQWVEITSGPYKGDYGKVVGVDYEK